MRIVFQELEMRIDTQKQTLSARDESIKKLLEMLQTKGGGQRGGGSGPSTNANGGSEAGDRKTIYFIK